MTTVLDKSEVPPASFNARLAGHAIFGAVAVLFAFYGVYFAQTLVLLPTEEALLAMAAQGQGPAFSFVLRAWQAVAGDSLIAARVLSLLAGVMAVVLAFRLGRRLTGDAVMAAFLALSFVLYPPLVAAFATATPHALFVLLALGVLAVLLDGPTATLRAQVLTGVVAGMLAVLAMRLHPLAPATVPVWIMISGFVAAQRVATAMALAAAVIGLVLTMLNPMPVTDIDFSSVGQGSVLKALALPYAMALVGAALSVAAAFSRTVRQAIGLPRLLAVLLGPVGAAAILLGAVATGWFKPGHMVLAAIYAFPLFFLAPWPLILWVRTVMPQVKSFAAWIVLPVIMYSCFWVILGPVDPGRFPYSHRQAAQPAGFLNR